MIDKDTPVYMISIVAKIAGVHPQTLRFYENEGLIKPSRTEGRTRLYSESDLVRIKKIVYLTREKGINVAGTHFILRLEDDIEKLFKAMAERLDDTSKEILLSLLKNLEFEELDVSKLVEILKK